MANEPSSDAELVERCRTGDEDAWRELVERFSRYVYAITQAFRLPKPDAEDVFQDVFAKTYERLADVRDGEAVRPWLAQITRRSCVDRVRSAARERPVEQELDQIAAEDRLGELEEAFTVQVALRTLPDDCREILDRFFARDESYRTIGDTLDLPPGTIASRISRCLARLRAQLGEEVRAHARLVTR
jgi:RNA polymerase sigma factor (sigma-70 family)